MTEFNKYLKEAREEFCKEVSKYNVSDNLQLRTACDSFLIAFDQATEKAINYTHCCETSIADFQIDDKITFKQHRSGIVTDVYINELQVRCVNGNYKTIGKNDVIEKH
jgi:hypothetical protein